MERDFLCFIVTFSLNTQFLRDLLPKFVILMIMPMIPFLDGRVEDYSGNVSAWHA